MWNVTIMIKYFGIALIAFAVFGQHILPMLHSPNTVESVPVEELAQAPL